MKKASGNEWTIYHVLQLLIEIVQLENISIIIKVKTGYFERCIVCLSKLSLDKATRQQSELLDHPSYISRDTRFPTNAHSDQSHASRLDIL